MAKKTLIDTPLAEVTLRKYEKPENLAERDLVKKFCLSVGLLQPGDSRDVVVDVLLVLLKSRKDRKELGSSDITERVIALRKEKNLAMLGIANSNIRRQLKRLRELFIVEKVRNNYRITEFAVLTNTYNEKFVQYLMPSIMNRVKEYFEALDEKF